MSITSKDIDNAIMEARVKVSQWGEEANKDFHLPETQLMVGLLWAKTDPQIKEIMKQFNPTDYKKIVGMFGE